MKNRKRIWSLALGVCLISAGVAGANCVATGKISRLRSATPPTTNAFVDIAPPNAGFPPFITFFTVPTNGVTFSMLSAAAAGHVTVQVTGNAASCPSVGAFRNGGTATFVDVFPQE